MMRLQLCLLLTAGMTACATAPADRTISVSEMDKARQAASTPLQKCLTGTGTAVAGRSLTQAQLKQADSLKGEAPNYIAQSLGLAPTNTLSMFGKTPKQGAQTGFTFKLGQGYSSNAQGWYQALAGGDIETASLLLAYERAGVLLPQETGGVNLMSFVPTGNDTDPAEAGTVAEPVMVDDETVADKLGVLGLVERGTLSLSMGDADCAVRFLDFAQTHSEAQQGSFFGSDLEGYEHIMMLNKKAMAYMLAGDVRARNMAIASRDLQNLARERHQADIEARLAEIESGEGGKEVASNPNLSQYVLQALRATPVAQQSQATSKLTTPYVNPLADYLSAVVAEAEASVGIGRADSWSTASVAWNNTSRLVPDTAFVKAASADARARQNGKADPNEKVVNVLVGVGSAPIKVVGAVGVPMEEGVLPIMLPVMTRSSTGIEGGMVSAGGDSAPLELISDVEAMALKNAEDEMPAEILAALARGYVAHKAGNATGAGSGNMFINAIGSTIRDTLAEPATDSWMSLPKAYYATRLTVPKDTETVAVTVETASGPITQSFDLLADSATFVHVTAREGGIWGKSQSRGLSEGKLDFVAQ